MPSLKDLHCAIELPGGTTTRPPLLREFNTTYGDGCVETFVAVPDHPQGFAIRLSSSRFIAPGLAMYVFIDGVYQCNRNRQNLKLRKPLDRKSLVEFVVRQKEERVEGGGMVARDWRFEEMDIAAANEAPETFADKGLDHLGCIEVIVLRCAGARNAKSADTKPMPMNMDGAGDSPDHFFGLDGGNYSNSPQFDDRPWEVVYKPGAFNPAMPAPAFAHAGHPPPLPSPLGGGRYYDVSDASTVRPSSRIRALSRSPDLIRYGTGPIPHQSRAPSVHAPAPSIVASRGPNLPFDPLSLDSKLMNMVNQGLSNLHSPSKVRPSPVMSLHPPSQARPSPIMSFHPPSQARPSPVMVPNAPSSQLPGSWPGQFGGGDSPLVSPIQNMSLGMPPPPPSVALGLQSPQQNTHISWQDDLPKPSQGWNDDKGWESGGEEVADNGSDSWNNSIVQITPEQANEKHSSVWKESGTREQIPDGWDFTPRTRGNSVVAQSTRAGPLSQSSEFLTARSRPAESVWEAQEDVDGWTHIDAGSDMTEAWVMTQSVHPSESVSHIRAPSVATHHTSSDPLAQTVASKVESMKKDEYIRRFETVPHPRDYGLPEPAWTGPFMENGFSTLGQFLRGLQNKQEGPLKWPGDDVKSKVSVNTHVTAPKQLPDVPPIWGTSPPAKFKVSVHSHATAVKQMSTAPPTWDTKPPTGGTRPPMWDSKPSKSIVSTKESKPNSGPWIEPTKEASIVWGWPAEHKRPSDNKHPPSKVSKSNTVVNGKPASQVSKNSAMIKSTVNKPAPTTVNEASWDVPQKPQDKPAGADSWQADMNGWADAPKPTSPVKESNPWDTDTGSKPQPSNPPPSQHQPQAPATVIGSKSNWDFPPPAPAAKPRSDFEKPASKGDPIVKVRKDDAEKKDIHHQVHLGKSSKYGHAIGRPEYIDSLDKPYAVFRFKYRSHAVLGKLLGHDVVPADPGLLTVSPADQLALGKVVDDPKDVKQQLKNVPKDALIDGLLDLQKKLEKTVGEKKDQQGGVGDWKTGWGKEQSGEDGKKDGKGEEGKGNKWGGAGQDGGNWAGW